jgi:hypothetical protein
MVTTIKQARYFNQESEIYLLIERAVPPTEWMEEERITLVYTDQIPKTAEHRQFHQIHPLDPAISSGFWVYTTERFFTLFDFMIEKQLENVTHLESDTMLYIDLKILTDRFKESNIRLSAPFQSLCGCIPCFFWIKDSESLSFLIHHMLFELENYPGSKAHIGVNDMQTLASFYVKFGSEYLTPLPTLMAEYGRYYPKRKSSFQPDNRTHLSFLSLFGSLFPDALFDAATLGIYINGTDPKYCKQGAGTVHARSLFNPHFFSFFWGEDEMGRAIPYLSFKGKTYRLFNLHFHSKKPEDYSSFRASRGSFP